MQILIILAVLASKLDDPTPPSVSSRAEGSHKIDDPFSRRILPASMIREPEPEPEPDPERKHEPPAEPTPAPKADRPPVCPCVLNAGVCSCAAEAKKNEPPVAAKPTATFTPGLAYPPKASVEPTLYQLADRTGKVWTSPDPAWLQTYVGQVNASLAPAPTYGAPVYQGYSAGSACASGSCAQPQSQGFNVFRGFRGR